VQVVFRLTYSCAVAIFFILVVIYGSRTFYSEPTNPGGSLPGNGGLYCNENDYQNGTILDRSRDDQLSQSDRAFVQAQRSYEDDRRAYSRNVFIIAGLLGVLTLAAGVYLYRRIEALPLGLVLGGIGAVIYGWVESSRDPGETNATSAFLVATLGFVVLAAGGYWFLNMERKRPGPTADESG